MKKISIIIFLGALAAAGCSNPAAQQQQQQSPAQNSQARGGGAAASANTNSAGAQRSGDDSLTVRSHGAERSSNPHSGAGGSAPSGPSATGGGGGGSPMQRGVDVSKETAAIEGAEKAYKAKPDDARLKDELAEAYFKRAFVLTDAAQYRAALGDFRKGLKLKPDAQEAKSMHDQIIDIFRSIGREPPKEGEEPPPAGAPAPAAAPADKRP